MFLSVYHGTESISYLRPKIWDILPKKLKSFENLGKLLGKGTRKIAPERLPPEDCHPS